MTFFIVDKNGTSLLIEKIYPYVHKLYIAFKILNKLDDNSHTHGWWVFILIFVYQVVLTFFNTTIIIDCKMTNTNVGLLNVSSLLNS